MLDNLKENNRVWAERRSPPTRTSSSDSSASRRRSIRGSAAPIAGCPPTRSWASIPASCSCDRNVANLAPPQDANYLSVCSSRSTWQVKHILVVGTTAAAASLQPWTASGAAWSTRHPGPRALPGAPPRARPDPQSADPSQPPVRVQRYSPGAERCIRRLRAGGLGARSGPLGPRLGLFPGQRPGEGP